LEPGKDLFSDLINTIRARTEIEQAKSNQDLQDHIQSIGVGIAAGAIIASTSGLMMTPWSLPTRDNWIKSFPLPPFIIALALSTFCSWGAWKLMKWRIESRRKRSLKNISQKPALKTEKPYLTGLEPAGHFNPSPGTGVEDKAGGSVEG
ncbi:MAG: hypothetical protein ACRC2M_19280, partial [Planktothrix sp.]